MDPQCVAVLSLVLCGSTVLMYFAILLFLVAIISLTLLRSTHHLCLLEAVNRSGADLLTDNGNISFSNIIVAVLRGTVGIRLCQPELDTNVSISWKEYQFANTSHPPLDEDWEAVRDAALSSTKQQLLCRNPDEETPLHLFIQSVVLSTFLRLFFSLPTTPANTEDVKWIASETQRRTDDRHRDFMLSPELSRLIKSSQNPSGVLALLSTARRLVLATVCTLESRGGKITFLRRAATLLRHPISPEPDVTRIVERAKKSNPPVQLVRGGIPFGPFPFCGTHEVDFLIPIDLLPPSACIMGPDGGCVSWLHKAALPGLPECSGERWLIRVTAVILSAIETEVRRAQLSIDQGEHEPEAWEGWILRRLRV